MTTVDKEVELLINDNMQFRFQLELSKTPADNKRTEVIKKILSDLEHKEAPGVKASDKLKDYFELMDKNAYTQIWSKLKPHQKQEKLNEFIDTVCKEITDNAEKETLKNAILVSFKKGDLTPTKEVTYDVTQMKITALRKLTKSESGKYVFKS